MSTTAERSNCFAPLSYDFCDAIIEMSLSSYLEVCFEVGCLLLSDDLLPVN